MQLTSAPGSPRLHRPSPVEWAVVDVGGRGVRVDSPVLSAREAGQLPAVLSAAQAEKWALVVADDRPADLLELRHSLEATGRPADLVVFAEGQSLEAAYELRHLARFQVGAEAGVTSLVSRLSGADSEQAARQWVQAAPSGSIHSALRTAPLESTAAAVKALVRQLLDQKVDPDLIYGSLLRTPAMSRDSLNADSHLRDLGAFLSEVMNDPAYPEEVREAAVTARRHYEACVVDRRSTPQLQALRAPTGATVTLPWKALSPEERGHYRQLGWSRDSGWGELLDYVLAPRPQAAPPALTGGLTGWLHREYKTFISPELDVRCGYQQSCSAFARQAVEEKGWLQGGYAGLLRFFSCDGSVAEDTCGPSCSHAPPQPGARVRPPSGGEIGWLEGAVIQVSKGLGAALGGALLGLVAVPLGAAWGAATGWRSGRGSLQQHQARLQNEWGTAVARGHQKLAASLQEPCARTGSGLAGALIGGALGAVAAAVGGARWGAQLGGLWLGNRVKHELGQLPPNPRL